MIINGHKVEYYDAEHDYFVDGKLVPSITQLLSSSFSYYSHVKRSVLQQAADRGTRIHNEIESYIATGEINSTEVRNFAWLQNIKKFTVLECEKVVVLENPLACGRLDLLVEMNGKRGIADIKTTSALQKDYVGYQLNLYRMAYLDSYGGDIDFLCAIHIRSDVRKMHMIPINEALTRKYIERIYYEHSRITGEID